MSNAELRTKETPKTTLTIDIPKSCVRREEESTYDIVTDKEHTYYEFYGNEICSFDSEDGIYCAFKRGLHAEELEPYFDSICPDCPLKKVKTCKRELIPGHGGLLDYPTYKISCSDLISQELGDYKYCPYCGLKIGVRNQT